jgi:2-haloacid dehalogenase
VTALDFVLLGSKLYNIRMISTNHKTPTLVFDLGGVLIDWDPRHLYRKFFPDNPQAVDRFLAEIGFAEWNHDNDAGRPMRAGVAELCSRFPQYCHLIDAYDTRYEESIAGPIQPTVEVVRALKQAGYPLYGLSNWPAEKYYPLRESFEFLNWFEDIVISGDIKVAKPDPRIFAILLDRIGRPAQECLFIDDAVRNTTAAQALGFQTILFHSAEQLADELRKLGFNF